MDPCSCRIRPAEGGCAGGIAVNTGVTETEVTSTPAASDATDESATSAAETSARSEVASVEDTSINVADMFTDRDLRSDYDASSAVKISLNGSSASISG